MRLTANQEHCLRVLAGGNYRTTDWSAWYPLRTSQIGGILQRLYNRGLVEPERWDGNARVWRLSMLGRDVLRARDRDEDRIHPRIDES